MGTAAVEGLGLAKAKRELRAAGLEVGDVDRRPSIKRRGTGLKQGVDRGTKLEPCSSIALVVAAALPQVPSVVGKPEASAIRNLKNAGFKVKKTTQTRTTGKNDVVVTQSPARGTRATPKSVVRIVISNVRRRPDPATDASRNFTPGYSPCLSPASDYDWVVAQATDLSTADRSVSRVPTRTTWTETVTERHASGRDQDAHPGLAVISG